MAKNSHFQEFFSGHQTCHYRRQILAIGAISIRGRFTENPNVSSGLLSYY